MSVDCIDMGVDDVENVRNEALTLTQPNGKNQAVGGTVKQLVCHSE